jgi:hypothetical protein
MYILMEVRFAFQGYSINCIRYIFFSKKNLDFPTFRQTQSHVKSIFSELCLSSPIFGGDSFDVLLAAIQSSCKFFVFYILVGGEDLKTACARSMAPPGPAQTLVVVSQHIKVKLVGRFKKTTKTTTNFIKVGRRRATEIRQFKVGVCSRSPDRRQLPADIFIAPPPVKTDS